MYVHIGGQTDVYLLWTVHHIAVDLWSFVVLLDDLGEIYSRLAQHATTAPRPQKSLRQYIECVASMKQSLEEKQEKVDLSPIYFIR